ncbi:MAG: response regulator transcription factor [Bacteroidales bacterium]|nr:response regulator transcription factor [Bacteroidales bacterium]MBN2817606.1 response regulator transcription factor [Bacteroidales bacterium]
MIKTLIIEDEQPAANRLEKILKEIDPEIIVIDKIDSIELAIEWFYNNKQPDLLMLDIQLADGLSFEIFNKVKVESFVIFTTAYDEYAIKAFELNSIDYLLKPINKEKLSNSILKLKKLKPGQPQFDIKSLIESIESKQDSYKKRFAISLGTKIKSVETNSVFLFYSLEKSTFLCTKEGQEYPVDFSLDKLEELLDPEQFFRISRQYLVKFDAIGKIHILSKSRLELEILGYPEKVLVSTAKTHTFREWIDK